jgi:hypothetical protein
LAKYCRKWQLQKSIKIVVFFLVVFVRLDTNASMKQPRSLRKVTTGFAGAAALAAASQAYGAVVTVTPPANIIGHAPAASDSGTRVNFDIDGNGTRDLSILYRNLTEPSGYLLLAYVYATTGSVVGAAIGTQAYAYNLGAGYTIGPSSKFYQVAGYFGHIVTNYNGTDYGFGTTGVHEYIGFSFMQGSTLEYAYIQLEVDPYVSPANPGGIQFFSIAYDNSGAPIITGAVPEPSTLAALAFGAAGLAGLGLKRRNRASAQS